MSADPRAIISAGIRALHKSSSHTSASSAPNRLTEFPNLCEREKELEIAGGEITALLGRVAHGEQKAEEELLRLVYDELKRVAARKLHSEKPGTTLTPTALVHESYLRVMHGNGVPLQNHRHLFFAFAQAMWRIVVERRRRRRLNLASVELDLVTFSGGEASADEVLDLDDAMEELKRHHPREYRIAVLRKGLGLGIQETATLLGTSPATVKRGWVFAKAALSRHLLDSHE